MINVATTYVVGQRDDVFMRTLLECGNACGR